MGEEILLSIDTTSSDVARAAVEAGVNMVNDVSGGVADSKMTQTVADLNVPYVYNLVPTLTLHTHTHTNTYRYVMMHRRGDTKTMTTKKSKTYADVVRDVGVELKICANEAQSSGIPLWNLMMDPGVGFSKTPEQSMQLLRNLGSFSPYPLLVGASRKRFLAHTVGRSDCSSPEDRDGAGAALHAVLAYIASEKEDMSLAALRVHNVGMTSDAIAMARSLVISSDGI